MSPNPSGGDIMTPVTINGEPQQKFRLFQERQKSTCINACDALGYCNSFIFYCYFFLYVRKQRSQTSENTFSCKNCNKMLFILQVGMILLSVDSHALSGCTVEEAEAILQTRYADKRHVSMKLTLLMPEDWTTM